MIWTSESLFAKAKLFYSKAQDAGVDSPDFALNSALSLELLSRSALSYVSPVLNADPQNEGQNILFALGFPLKKGFPRSIPFHSVTIRLEQIVDNYQKKACREFSEYFAGLRNEELHTGGAPFENLKNSEWLPKFYQTVAVLCEFMKKDIDEIVGDDAEHALELIKDQEESDNSKAKEKIGIAKAAFGKLSKQQQEAKTLLAATDPTHGRWGYSKVTCPACSSDAALYGIRSKTSEPQYDGGLFCSVTFKATKLVCKACALELSPTPELIAAGVNISFTEREDLDLHDYFQPEYPDDYGNM
ncbi:hypothetical protein [Chryseosolibacter indicus]|uniref:HEPN domain-containing protein n=1 Tax=Chryseosolibacter indicus TaxID=2782351 RepID=A0ABS5VV10_9BACT|nr:hypothetical protein [Chryseosolibacter indicus]MBT1705272.1 hypothetical protein [Chryseosolibacter indicus]